MRLIPSASLKNLNTLAIDISCRYLAVIESRSDIMAAFSFIKREGLPFVILGGGSNVLFTEDFPGVVVLNRFTGMQAFPRSNSEASFVVNSGENWHKFVCETNGKGFRGLENLALIPGSVGAAPVQNIGAYGEQVANHITEIEVYEPLSGCFSTFTPDICHFGYRDSIFKKNPQQYFIVSVTFFLSKERPLNLTYAEVASRHAQNPFTTALELNRFICETRTKKLPSPEQIPNVGSFFKNPVVSDSAYLKLKVRYPDLVSYPDPAGRKLAAGWLIDQAGWKGYRNLRVGVHDKQALVLINHHQGSGKEILSLAQDIQSSIKLHFGVDLEIEPAVY